MNEEQKLKGVRAASKIRVLRTYQQTLRNFQKRDDKERKKEGLLTKGMSVFQFKIFIVPAA